jgi:hypothetical protein
MLPVSNSAHMNNALEISNKEEEEEDDEERH